MTWITTMMWSLTYSQTSWSQVKWALGSITMNEDSGGDRIPAELYQIPKDDAVKVLHSIYHQIWKFGNSAVATGLEKVSFHSSPKEGQC